MSIADPARVVLARLDTAASILARAQTEPGWEIDRTDLGLQLVALVDAARNDILALIDDARNR